MKILQGWVVLGVLLVGLGAGDASAFMDSKRQCGRVWDQAFLSVRNSVEGYTRVCKMVPGGNGNVSCDDGTLFFFQNCEQRPISQGGLMCDACGVINFYALSSFF